MTHLVEQGTKLRAWAKDWANTIRMNWGEPNEDLEGTLIEAALATQPTEARPLDELAVRLDEAKRMYTNWNVADRDFDKWAREHMARLEAALLGKEKGL